MKEATSKYLYLIFIGIGFIFLRSGYGKVAEGKFVGGLGATLQKFASNNPYPVVKNFLESSAIPNASFFAYLTMWGELLVGINLIVLSLYLLLIKRAGRPIYMLLSLGLFFGALLNLVFWLSAGWTSPSTDGLNLVMLIVQVIGIVFVTRQIVGGN